MNNEKAAAPVQAQEPRKPTDISQRLREYAGNNGYSHNDYADTMRAAADEIERYHGGMMAWKQTAEKKDADWNAERMARVDERIANRNSAPGQPVAVPDGWRDNLVGLHVSMDVSTGEENGGDRIFGEIEEVMDDGDALVLLAVESSRNFAAPAAQVDAKFLLPESVEEDGALWRVGINAFRLALNEMTGSDGYVVKKTYEAMRAAIAAKAVRP